jgi:hypothetical protein
MNAIEALTLDHGKAAVAVPALEKLRKDLSGDLVVPGDEGYDEARTIWNAMIDKRPALVVRCREATDVQ